MKWLILLSIFAAKLVKVPSPVVRTESGLVRGELSDSGTIYQYFGIPYATVNENNRFQAPLPPPKWNGVFEAINQNVQCPQKLLGPVVHGQEDCLKLNIHAPVLKNSDKLLPVMVFIHGGAFLEGSGTALLYSPDFLVSNEVVYVGVNYRLSVEGFLCLGIKEAPGNAGLKDQIAALMWIKKNIRAFGGDPDNVTLFGESAGAVSTSYLILSPAAQGLFHKAILQSGSSLAPWGTQHDPIKTASNLAKDLGHNTSDPHELYRILSRKSPEDLISAIKYLEHRNFITAETLFVPCIEKEIPDIVPIITKFPSDIIISGNYTKVPMIIGYNDREGLYLVGRDFGNKIAEVNPAELLTQDLYFPTEENKNSTVDEVRKYYFSSEKEDKTLDVVDFYGDLHFKFPTVIESELYMKTTNRPIYYYMFKYNGLMNLPKFVTLFGFTKGASHADELFYMFKPQILPFPYCYMEFKMIKRMVTLWTNFAKYGDPTPRTSRLIPIRWKPSRTWDTALIIDDHLTTGPLWEGHSVRLWNDTYTKYRRKDYGFPDVGRVLLPTLSIDQFSTASLV